MSDDYEQRAPAADAADDKVQELRVENERLRAALKPFADWGAKMVEAAAYGDACPLGVDPERQSPGPTVGDLRRALATLTK